MQAIWRWRLPGLDLFSIKYEILLKVVCYYEYHIKSRFEINATNNTWSNINYNVLYLFRYFIFKIERFSPHININQEKNELKDKIDL